MGLPVIPAGAGDVEVQLQAIADIGPTAYVGPPSFLEALLLRGGKAGLNTSSFKKALIAMEPLTQPVRDLLREEHGIKALQCYATSDLGLIAYESRAGAGLVVDEAVIVEIVRPGTGEPVMPGEVGEVLVTAFNPDYPLIRFATGDLSTVLSGASPCGRTNMRIAACLGRADECANVGGMIVFPSQVDELIRRHAPIQRAQLVVARDEGRDAMRLVCEVAGDANGLEAGLAESVRGWTGLRTRIEFVAPGTLPSNGKLIDDQR